MDLTGDVAGAFDGAIDGGTSHSEELGDLNGVFPCQVNGGEMCFLRFGELGLLSAELALCLGDGDPLTGACSYQICLEFGDHGQNIEKKLTHGIGGITDGAADAEFDLAAGEFIDDVLCIAQ